MIISLSGLMGAGKSTVAQVLAQKLNYSLTDLDFYIEKKEGSSINDLFVKLGEEGFRKIESDCLFEILSDAKNDSLVLSLGGGTLISPGNRKLVKEYTFCVYLRSQPDTLAKRLLKNRNSRPVIKDTNEDELLYKLTTLSESRDTYYLECSSFIVDTDLLSIEECVQKILEKVVRLSPQ